MDGHGDDGLQDLFPEGDPAFPAPAFDLLSQAESSGVPREGLQALDLNSQAEDWGDYSSYSDLLRGEGAPRGRGSRSLGLRAARSGGRGGGSGSRAGAGGSRGGGGGSRAGGGGSRAGAGGSRAGGGGASVTRPLFEPSLADGAGGSGGRSGGRGGGRARRSRGRGGRSTADYIEPYDVENWVDVDDEDGAPQNVETIFPTSKGKFSECKKFRYGVPHYIDQLEEMFRDVVVDGSTSFVAGCEEDEDQDVDDVEEDDQYGTEGDVNAYEDSPMSYNTKKRGSTPSTKSTATSPSKKSKSPLLKMVSSLVDKLTTSDKDDGLLRSVGESIATSLNEKRQKLNPIKEMGESVKRCQQLALECGAAPESVEFYACRHLFKDPYEREFFCNIPTPEGRLRYVLSSVLKLAVDIIKPKDPEFRTVHPRLRNPRFAPYFNNCIGAIDGTHIPVVVPNDKVVQHTGRHGYTSQNVLAICDFDMRFTFAVTGWPGSVHDMRVFSDALNKYGDKFPHPPAGKFYLVDSGYANRPGYLAPYKGTKYHLPEFRSGPMPKGMKETFNYAHSSLRNVIERSFGVLKMKWRILLGIPSFPMQKQSKIIVACMAIHNFIRENDMADRAFDMCDRDENFIPMPQVPNDEGDGINTQAGEEDCNMNAFRDELANALYNKS